MGCTEKEGISMKLETGRFLKITELYAFVSVDENGHEGIIAGGTKSGLIMPFIGADIERVNSLIPIADEIIKETGMKYEIRYFKQV